MTMNDKLTPEQVKMGKDIGKEVAEFVKSMGKKYSGKVRDSNGDDFSRSVTSQRMLSAGIIGMYAHLDCGHPEHTVPRTIAAVVEVMQETISAMTDGAVELRMATPEEMASDLADQMAAADTAVDEIIKAMQKGTH